MTEDVYCDKVLANACKGAVSKCKTNLVCTQDGN